MHIIYQMDLYAHCPKINLNLRKCIYTEPVTDIEQMHKYCTYISSIKKYSIRSICDRLGLQYCTVYTTYMLRFRLLMGQCGFDFAKTVPLSDVGCFP